MAEVTLVPVSFAGNLINDGTDYDARFIADDQAADWRNRVDATAIETELPGGAPTYVRNDVQARRILIEIELLTYTAAAQEQLKKWFDPANGQQYLVAEDGDENQRRILCFPERLVVATQQVYHAVLLASDPHWEENTATTDTIPISASGQTFEMTNVGNARSYPTFTITPNSQMDHDDSYIHRRRVVMVNRSEKTVSDPVGDGWPVNVFGTTLDTDALNTASKLQSDLDDLRVMLNGAELNRWPDPSSDNASSKLWCNLQMRPRRTATLGNDQDIFNLIDFEASNASGLQGWPPSGAFLVDNELVIYRSRTDTAFLSTDMKRGARGTAVASHTAGATIYFVEHIYLDVLYDYTAAANPPAPTERKPAISLSSSTNSKFVWDSVFIQAARRSACWQALFSDEGFTAAYIRLYESGGALIFEDAAPVAGKPGYNNVVLDTPYGIKAAAAAVELDFTVNNGLYLPAWLTDFDGYESRLFAQGPTGAASNQQYQPGAVASRMRIGARNGCIIGNRSGTTEQAITNSANVATANGEHDAAIIVLSGVSRITGFIVKVSDGSPASTRGLNFWLAPLANLQDFSAGAGSRNILLGNIANGDMPANGAAVEVVVATSSEIRVPAGTYVLIAVQDGNQSNSNLWFQASRVNDGIYARQYVTGTGYVEALARTPWVVLLTKDTEPQANAPVESGDDITLDNIELTWDDATPRTPNIIVGAEEDFYLAQFRLANNTTGGYLDVLFPMSLSQSIEIDCGAKRITDLETGLEIPFAIRASDPAEWPYNRPGVNEWEYTEVGVVDTDVAFSYRGRWL